MVKNWKENINENISYGGSNALLSKMTIMNFIMFVIDDHLTLKILYCENTKHMLYLYG